MYHFRANLNVPNAAQKDAGIPDDADKDYEEIEADEDKAPGTLSVRDIEQQYMEVVPRGIEFAYKMVAVI